MQSKNVFLVLPWASLLFPKIIGVGHVDGQHGDNPLIQQGLFAL
jgi:hypothetical protein